ncbi:hypothetical protein BX616_003344 [Lobosporangium transversale]|uniref:Uncharacterized protein n=1 Tax=Lobosporangium transversale TaxID=64571 RepID=A0A1Y2GXG5_9FUNG|nr:hypothetical protein BCR41DRAFT_347170 [Lobosporangium transversale]KAF9899035.1 hypothetical protein BX616_003344 [Lobosporangium transversale]ORZ26980.1 hypothetical protein BCR41DRAFT_347170 [Lobosporangium transversale]|eukprot:XP_021884727.1 hypothetical protein BCR41DRAFT_347170 [Lobosporangium transversale]
MNNHTTEQKPSTVETIKEKASHLLHKVTGKDHHEGETTHTTTHPEGQHHHGQANTHAPAPVATGHNAEPIYDPNTVAAAAAPGAHNNLPTHAHVSPNVPTAAATTVFPTGPQGNHHHVDHHHGGTTTGASTGAEAVFPSTGAGTAPITGAHGSHHHVDHHHGGVNADGATVGTALDATHHNNLTHKLGEHHSHENPHHGDDPQHGVTTRLVGVPGDVNNLEGVHLKPTM